MRIKVKQMPAKSGVTNGKVYEVLEKCEYGYQITNDAGVEVKIHRNNCEVINGHPHADLIMKYAEIAQHDAEPWEYFEADFGCGWVDVAVLTFHEAAKYRLKPRTININGFEVPEPLRHEPSDGTDYYVLDMSEVSEMTWTSDVSEYQWLNAGIIHLTREVAEKHLEALLSFTKE